jgi:transitional endoplasmic reticulum ATPase
MVSFPLFNHERINKEVNMNTKTNADKEWFRKLTTGGTVEKKEPAAPVRRLTAETENVRPNRKDAHGFRDVAGMDSLKQLVTEGFINVLNNQECAKAYGITPPSLLFYGPAGCGKTFFAEKIAEEVDINFMKIVPDDLASTLVHGTQEKIGEVFRKAERKAPTIIFFDEFDAMVPKRTNDDRNYQNGETNEFLCMLNNASEKGIYVLAATNHPERIDKAVLRTGRIDEMIYVDMPDCKARESLFRLTLSKLPTAEDIDYGRLADLTNGYNCSDISYIVKVASRKMFNASIQEKDKPYQVITQSLLEESISLKSPSVSSRELKEFERVRCEFSPKDAGCRQTTIGFHV